jgi:hypothetical protein
LTTFDVQTSNRTPFVAQTGMQIQHVRVQSLSNPYQDVVIDEHISDVGGETWPSPTGWSASNPTSVPSDAYTVVLHYETTIDSRSATYKDKVTVVRKQSNTPSAGLSTLTVRRASMGMGDAGRVEAQIINRFFPCDFPVGTLIGRDVTGGWARPMAALPAGANGKSTADPAVNGTIPVRSWYSGAAPSTWNFRTGYYGHEDYHSEYTPTNRFTPNTYPENGEYPFNGNEFWLSWRMKLSPMINLRENSTKLMFLDQHQTPDMSQIVMNSPKRNLSGTLLGNLLWFHNYGSNSNSDLPDIESVWSPALGEWFDLMIHIRAGHDNRMEYNSGYTISEVVSKVDSDPNYGGQPTITLRTDLITLAPGLTLPSGRYPVSAQNPQALDPQRSGYFDNWRFEFKGDAVNGTYRSKDFKILSHTVSGGSTTFVITKLRELDTWPSVPPAVGNTVKFSWIDLDTSARYKDTLVELFKKESADTDWIPVRSFNWAITYNGGSSDSSAGNCKGFNNFQPTGYANIDDNNPPGSRTIYARYADIILSQSPIGAPQ